MLQRMLDDRAASVQSVQDTGRQLAGSGEQLDKDLAHMQDRWQALQQQASERQAVLDTMVAAARDYNNALLPMLKWLDDAGKKVASVFSNIPTDPNAIVQRLADGRTLQDDVVTHKPQLDNVVLAADELQKHAVGKSFWCV
jgi:septal ring factor EnvC (AmiA/AmiB activator)